MCGCPGPDVPGAPFSEEVEAAALSDGDVGHRPQPLQRAGVAPDHELALVRQHGGELLHLLCQDGSVLGGEPLPGGGIPLARNLLIRAMKQNLSRIEIDINSRGFEKNSET